MHQHALVPSLSESAQDAASSDLDAVIHAPLAKTPDGSLDSALAVTRALDASDG